VVSILSDRFFFPIVLKVSRDCHDNVFLDAILFTLHTHFMDAIQLEDLIPQGATFTLRKTEKTYRLNAVSLGDELWMNQQFGESLSDIFQNIRMKEICRIVFRLLDDEDKEDFAARDVTIMNELGEKVTNRIGGAELLFLMVSGFQEKIEIFEALLQTIGISRPILNKMKEEVGAPTKPEEKKTPQTGRTSLTSSRTNMDGRRNTSSHVRPKRSLTGSKPLTKGSK
jgi:hypothetical protein